MVQAASGTGGGYQHHQSIAEEQNGLGAGLTSTGTVPCLRVPVRALRLFIGKTEQLPSSRQSRPMTSELPPTAEMPAVSPSMTPARTGVRIHGRCRIHPRCRIDGIFLNHHSRWRYNDRPANDDRLASDGGRLCDNDRRRRPVFVAVSFALIACAAAIGSYG
jgi:hypothetical protein